jgi:uncharacterized SAM-binding protein YcdF (DUF218 family)
MPDAWYLKTLLGSLLLPPCNVLVLLALAGLFRKRRGARALAFLGGFLLLAQSLPLVSGALMASLESRAGPALTDPAGAQAIVVLGGGLYENAPDYGGDTVNERSLVRARYGATLARRFNLPVLVSGGTPTGAQRPEADAMGDVLERELGIPVRWRDVRARDTADNARFSARILHAEGIRSIVLVTEAFHIPRARRLFEAAGFEVVAAPTNFKGRRAPPLPLDLLPQTKALQTSYFALHEWLGLAWAALVQRVRPDQSSPSSTQL